MDNGTFVVIPAFNEEKTISSVIKSVKKYFNKIIVVDDGSTDKTYEIAKKHKVNVLRHCINLGAGSATMTGIEYAIDKKAEIIATIDADEQHLARDLKRVVDSVAVDKADIAIGSRLFIFSREVPAKKRFGNLLLTYAINFLSGAKITDSQSGLRAFKSGVFQKIKFNSRDFSMSSEIIMSAHRNKLNIREVPIKAIYTDYSKSKGTTIMTGAKILFTILYGKLLGD